MAIFMPAFGVTVQTPDDTVKKIAHDVSPIFLINPSFPPTLLVHGDADTLVPVQQSKELDAAFESAKIVHKLIIVPGGGHGGDTVIKAALQALDWFDAHLRAGP